MKEKAVFLLNENENRIFFLPLSRHKDKEKFRKAELFV
jgi:hypothetical protein